MPKTLFFYLSTLLESSMEAQKSRAAASATPPDFRLWTDEMFAVIRDSERTGEYKQAVLRKGQLET
jgi:hypothetical protein